MIESLPYPAVAGVLTEEELACILKVPTTREQAVQILHRNLMLLGPIDFWMDHIHHLDCLTEQERQFESGIGCPHCDLEYTCDRCAWQGIKPSPWMKHPCCSVPFGGVTYISLNSLKAIDFHYQADSEHLELRAVEGRSMAAITEDLLQVRRYLRGHIEWAQAVLQRSEDEEPGPYEAMADWMRSLLQEAEHEHEQGEEAEARNEEGGEDAGLEDIAEGESENGEQEGEGKE